MINYINEVEKNVRIEEGVAAIEQFLISVYFESPISNRDLSKAISLPIPLVSAIKKEFIKLGLLRQYNGITITEDGKRYVEKQLAYEGLDKELYKKIANEEIDLEDFFEDEIRVLEMICSNRPSVDRSIDQAHATHITSLKRAILAIKYNVLINKKILCLGDDDLVSISIGLLLKKLYKTKESYKTEIHVMDIDERFLDYINQIALDLKLPIFTHSIDFRDALVSRFEGEFDCFYTDPPYTLSGIDLFLSRGISLLKNKKGLPIFFSFAHKSYDYSHEILCRFSRLGLSLHHVEAKFNSYLGAGILGSVGQLFVLYTTSSTKPIVASSKSSRRSLYTREVRNALKSKNLALEIEVDGFLSKGFGERC